MRSAILAALCFASAAAPLHAAAPASAVQAGHATFFGTATIRPGLVYPGIDVLGSCDYTNHIKVVAPPPVGSKYKQDVRNPVPGCRRSSWAFNSDVCVGSEVAALKAPPKSPVGAGVCIFQISGTLNGWCGSTSGMGTGVYIDAQNQPHSLRIVWTQSIGGWFPLTGEITKANTGQRGPIDGVVDAVPIPIMSGPITNENSCASTYGAQYFTIMGDATYIEG